MRIYKPKDDIHPLGELVNELVRDFHLEPDPAKLNSGEEAKEEKRADRDN